MTLPIQHFAEKFQPLTDEELLQLASERDHMVEAASVALREELERRRLGEDALQEFKDRQRTQVSEEDETPPEHAPATEIELPQDWFDETEDEKGEVACATSTLRRPKGITVIAFMCWLGAGLNLFNAMVLLGSSAPLAAFLFTLSIIVVAVGVGLWRLRPWARKLAIVLCWMTVLVCGGMILSGAIQRLRGFAVEPVFALQMFFGAMWNGVWALYLQRPGVQAAFHA